VAKKEGKGMIHPAARMISMEGMAGSFLVTGTDKIRSGYGNGDCVLLDFQHNLFALSDSTERFSRSSRDLLERLHGGVALNGVPGNIEDWRALVNGVFALQNYRHKATFSCVALSKDGDSVTLRALNGGDSVIMVVNASSGKVEYMSRSDMYFAGRSREIAHVAEIRLSGDEYRVMLFSDGIADIAKLSGAGVLEMMMGAADGGVSELPARIRERVDRIDGIPGAEYDDAGFLVLDPGKCLGSRGPAILMGGTSPQEEAKYQRDYRRSSDWGRWMDMDEMESRGDGVRECGISILQ